MTIKTEVIFFSKGFQIKKEIILQIYKNNKLTETLNFGFPISRFYSYSLKLRYLDFISLKAIFLLKH